MPLGGVFLVLVSRMGIPRGRDRPHLIALNVARLLSVATPGSLGRGGIPVGKFGGVRRSVRSSG